jgi:cytochrome P450
MTITDEEIDRLSEARFELASGSPGRKRPDWSGLPDGPKWPVVAQSIGLVRYRHQFVPWLHRKYGDVFTVRLVPGPRPLVLFTRPEHTREIFAGSPEIFHAGKGNSILGPIMGEHSLLLQDSTEHKRARRLLMPAFNGHALHGYESLVTEVARDQVATWSRGEEFRALDRMNALTLDVILRVVFGVADEARLAALRPKVQKIVDINPALLLGWAFPRLRRLRPWQELERNQRALDRLMYDEIAARREVPDLAERTDVLSRLILTANPDGHSGDDALTDTELRDQLVTLLLAGHETTATALAWALYELGSSRTLLERSRAAARDGDNDWLEAVLKESMRLHPVIPMVVRQLMAPVTIGGIDLPAGIFVGTSILVAHAREDNHADPAEFRPERFLEHNPPANTWIPFGGGVRRCIGAGFSLMEGTAALREILKEYDVSAVGDELPKVRNITSVPEKGARIRIS